MANPQRRRRVADQIQRELSEILRIELKDPRVGMITLTGVEVSSDLAHAKVFFTSLAEAERREETQQGLARASKTLRNIRSAWIKEQQVRWDGGRISEYQVNMMVTFVIDD